MRCEPFPAFRGARTGPRSQAGGTLATLQSTLPRLVQRRNDRYRSLHSPTQGALLREQERSAYPSIVSEEFDQALGRLAQIVDELTRVPIDDFPTRDALMRERDSLREQLAELRGSDDPDAARSTHQLSRELEALERSADALRKLRIDQVVQSGGGPREAPTGGAGVTAINIRMSEATGLAAMERRIQRLRSIIQDRESD